MRKAIKRASLIALAVFATLSVAMPAWAQSVDPVTVSTTAATSLKDTLLNVFSSVAPIAILVLAAVLGITFAVKMVKRFSRA